ncbi:MAG: M28 family peptidase [Bacteroidota bacterium]
MKRLALVFVIFVLSFGGFAQDTLHVRRLVDTLSSQSMYGRGYVNEGDKKAAKFIANEFQKTNSKTFGSSYFQPVSFAVNTFPQNMEVKIDDSTLTPFYDYKVTASSSGSTGVFEIVEIPIKQLKSLSKLKKLLEVNNFSNKFVYLDVTKISKKKQKRKSYKTAMEIIQAVPYQDIFGAKGVIIANDKLEAQGMWSKEPLQSTIIRVLRSKLAKNPKTIKVNIENKFLAKYTSQNVISYIEGTTQPDTFIVFSGHYDHLGCLGDKTIFPGANDNASGIAFMIDLANYYSKPENKPYYSIAFMAFTGEEVRILGSKYYVENPLFPLSKIKFLFNLDMVGTGDEGITLVNATANKSVYQQIDTLNKINKYLPKVDSRGESENSDHHYFHKAGVPAVFIYGTGKSGPYHHPEDNSANLTLKGYIPIFKLLTTFINTYR